MFFGAELYDTSHHTLALIVRRADLEDCVASDLEIALVPHVEPGEIYITDDDEEEYHYEESPPLPVSFDIAADCLRTKVEFRVPAWLSDADDGEGGSSTALEQMIVPLLKHHGLNIHDHELLGSYGLLWLDHDDRDIDLSVLFSAAEDVLALLDASRGGELTMTTAAGLVKAGRVHSLVGTAENSWFDAKVAHYQLDALPGKIALAESVARFCNGDGGILVIGLETVYTDGIEVVSRIKPLPLNPSMAQRYRKIIDQHVYPFPDRLRVTTVPVAAESGMIMIVEVPSQPDYNKPYLVSGAIVGGKSRGEFISVVQRRDDGSEPIKASMIHAWIATGRALIQRGELANRPPIAPVRENESPPVASEEQELEK